MPYTSRYGQFDEETENDKSYQLNWVKKKGQKYVSEKKCSKTVGLAETATKKSESRYNIKISL